MSHPTCCCCSASLDRGERCDLLVGLEGFHLMGMARTPDALVLDVESCNQLARSPRCGVIAQGHGRMVVEVIDAPWSRVPVRIRWHKRRWICREHACQTVTFLEHDERMCAPRARLGARAIRRAIGQLRFEGTAIAGQASDDQHCMTCTSHGSNGKISTPSLSTDARLKLIVQPAPAAAGSGLDLYEELNVHRDHVQVTEAWHQD